MTLTETLTVLTIPKLTGPMACSQSACVLVKKSALALLCVTALEENTVQQL